MSAADYPVPGSRFLCGCNDPLSGEWITGWGGVGNDGMVGVMWDKGRGTGRYSHEDWKRLGIVVTERNVRSRGREGK